MFQYTGELDLNFDFALPVGEEHRGRIVAKTYPSPEFVVPETDIHDFAIYLPSGYNHTDNYRYSVLYLSHGGGENAGAWPNNAKSGNIMDRLIVEGYIEPTVVVMTTFYYLVNDSTPRSTSSATPSFTKIREKYMQYLFPYIEANDLSK
jgi:enterochelin esterase-like enzyme